MALVIPANTLEPVRAVSPADGKKFTLDELQSLVGGYIEHIPYKINKTRVTDLPKDARGKVVCNAWCDEEGKLKGQPHNVRASALFAGNMGGDRLVGSVVFTYAGEF